MLTRLLLSSSFLVACASEPPPRCSDPVNITVMTTGDFTDAEILINGEPTGHGTVDTVEACNGDFIGVDMPGYMDVPKLVGSRDETIIVPVGREIDGTWTCDREPRTRNVSMGFVLGILFGESSVMAVGLLNPAEPIEMRRAAFIDVDTLTEFGSDVTGMIAPDGNMLEYVESGSVTTCAR